MDLSQEDLQQNRAPELIAIYTVFSALTITTVILRVLARRVAHLRLWWDDWLLIVSGAIVIVQYVLLLEAIQNGEGKHAAIVPKEDIVKYLMYTYILEIFYAVIVTSVKCSILCLYLRLFGVRRTFAKICYGLIVFVVAWGIGILVSTILQCIPIAAAWDKTIVDAYCIDLRSWLIGNNVPNITADVVIILLPVRVIWELKLSVLRKLGLCCIFLMAFATTIVSIIRVDANARIDVIDVTWGYVGTAEYSTVETNVGVMCACLPVLAPLIKSCFARYNTTNHSGSASSGSNTVKTKRTRPSARRQVFTRLDDVIDAAALPNTSSAARGRSTPGFGSELDGAIALGGITVRNDVVVESDTRSASGENGRI